MYQSQLEIYHMYSGVGRGLTRSPILNFSQPAIQVLAEYSSITQVYLYVFYSTSVRILNIDFLTQSQYNYIRQRSQFKNEYSHI